MPFLQCLGGDGAWVEGYDCAASVGADGAQGVEHAGVVVAVDGGLHEDHAVDTADGGVEAYGVGEGVWCGSVLGVGGKGVGFWVDDVHVAVP